MKHLPPNCPSRRKVEEKTEKGEKDAAPPILPASCDSEAIYLYYSQYFIGTYHMEDLHEGTMMTCNPHQITSNLFVINIENLLICMYPCLPFPQPVLYTLLVTAGTFTCAHSLHVERMKSKRNTITQGPFAWIIPSYSKSPPSSSNSSIPTISSLPTPIKESVHEVTTFARDQWRYFKTTTVGKQIVTSSQDAWNYFKMNDPINQVVGGIVLTNTIIFLCWSSPRLNVRLMGILNRFFLHTPAHDRVSQMTLSTFSHQGVIHLACNMYPIVMFFPGVARYIGMENAVALYISGGTFSSLISLWMKAATSKIYVPSLGASGAVCTIAAAHLVLYPNQRYMLPLLPESIDGTSVLKLLGAINAFGLVFLDGTLVDYAAHLGGLLYGLLYIEFGKGYIG